MQLKMNGGGGKMACFNQWNKREVVEKGGNEKGVRRVPYMSDHRVKEELSEKVGRKGLDGKSNQRTHTSETLKQIRVKYRLEALVNP